MGLNLFTRLRSGVTPYILLGVSLLALAYLLSAATQDSSRFNDLFLSIFGLGIAILVLLVGILGRSLFKLYRDFKAKKEGARLTLRLVSLFALLILVSTTIVYSFSIHFLHRGINSWFDVKVEQALNDSLELSRTAFGIRMRTLLRQTRMMTGLLSELPERDLNHNIRELTQLSGAIELSLWTMSGQLITTSLENPALIIPSRPNEAIFHQLEQKEDYIGLDPDHDNLQLRAAVRLPIKRSDQEERFLQVIFPVNAHLSSLGKTVQNAYTDYKELSYLRKPLIDIFTLALSLIVLLTLLASIWFSLWISRRVVHPLQELAEGTKSVASGNYNTKLHGVSSHDEIGFLVRSFNQMTQRLTQERHATQNSHRQLEQQTHYLSTVLGSLSSGVITIDNKHLLRTANIASSKILHLDLQQRLESTIKKLGDKNPYLHPLTHLIKHQLTQQESWQQQIELQQKKGLQTLMCRGTLLPNDAGWVVVFDDVTTLLQAQRNAAWGEVAKRLAHEIKNPLTPIQLSADRLQHKYLPLLPEEQTHTLTKLTNTIISQVEAMKEMVNDFSDYARNPGLQLQSQAIGELIREVLALYQSNHNHQFTLLSPAKDISLEVDSTQIRQVLHNLFKNAIEASEEAQSDVDIVISYHTITFDEQLWLEITLQDHGPGIPDDMVNTLFEPYATNKTKGTGLGLAIVKKIIEEHHGQVWAENTEPTGACIIIRLPLKEMMQ
ncbi:MAG: ATP-binding protein [Gammaproteobacteria bacterium]|nr:ATP-binding protein [Gammaproteobacteria bacterium]